MSLHEEIRTKGTPVRRFFEENFPNVNAVRKDLAARARDAVTTRPLESANYPWTATGSAIDYRIRLAFPHASSYLPRWEDASPLSGFSLAIDSKLPRPFPAEIAASCGEPYGPFQSWAGAFFQELHSVLGAAHANDEDPAKQPDPALEEKLVQLCYVLGLYDSLHHGEPAVRSPLYERLNFLPSLVSITDALSLLCPPHVTADLVTMTTRFYEEHRGLLDAARVELSPTFAGSSEIGGADADLIVGNCLIDVKALVDPVKYSHPWPWQLLGYSLLDFEDTWEIKNVAIYLARQARLIEWSLEELCLMLGGSGQEPLSKVRIAFQHAVTTMARENMS